MNICYRCFETVGLKSIDRVRYTVMNRLWRLKGSERNDRCIENFKTLLLLDR